MGDHHAWTAAEAADLAKSAKAMSAACVLVTAKDAVKLVDLPWPSDAPRLAALDVEIALREGADVWKALLDEALA
jgi:tetraacyldisaccharide-1-P 4'-kinase